MAQNKNQDLERTGTVTESLPNIMFRVKLDPPPQSSGEASPRPPTNGSGEASTTDEPILAYLSGRMRLHRIRVLVGDRVVLELEPYGGKAKITKRV